MDIGSDTHSNDIIVDTESKSDIDSQSSPENPLVDVPDNFQEKYGGFPMFDCPSILGYELIYASPEIVIEREATGRALDVDTRDPVDVPALDENGRTYVMEYGCIGGCVYEKTDKGLEGKDRGTLETDCEILPKI